VREPGPCSRSCSQARRAAGRASRPTGNPTLMRGIVFDDWDLRTAKRIAKRIPGVKRVIDDLEIKLGGE